VSDPAIRRLLEFDLKYGLSEGYADLVSKKIDAMHESASRKVQSFLNERQTNKPQDNTPTPTTKAHEEM